LVAAPAAPLGRTAGRSARGGPARRGLDVQRVSDLRAAVPLVAHVDLVVAPVGPDPPGAEEPAPEPEPPLLGQRPVEQQHVLAPGEVHALALGHAVDVDVERGAHSRRKLHAPAFHRRTDIIKSSMGGRTGTDSSGPAPSEQLGVAPAFTPRPFAAAGWAWRSTPRAIRGARAGRRRRPRPRRSSPPPGTRSCCCSWIPPPATSATRSTAPTRPPGPPSRSPAADRARATASSSPTTPPGETAWRRRC